MMSSKALALAAACLAAWPVVRAAEAPTIEQRLAARLDGDRTGACVFAAVVDHDRVVTARHCAGTRADGPPADDAAFEIGSVTKTMTAFLVADLVERGKWSLDDPIATHLPAGTPVPRQGERQILVRDLLTHTAGLPALPPGMAITDPTNPYAGLTEDALLASLGKAQLARPIGSQPEYSNFGMMVVSLAVARSEGGSLEAALRERLFKPLGMHASIVASDAEKPANGHLPGGQRTPAWTIAPNLAGVGMVRANLDDMVRYARAGLGDAPADVALRMQRAEQPVAAGFAMNWMRRDVKGHDLLLHEGATGGFSSLVALEPATHRAVVLLADTSMADLGGLGDIGLALLGVDVPVQPPRRDLAATPAQRTALAGDWEMGGLKVSIWVADDGRLMAQAQGQPAFEMRHDSFGDFYPVGVAALLTPVPADTKDGPLTRFAWHQGGGLVEGRRVGTQTAAAPAIANPAWRDWAGDYAITTQFGIRVFERDGKLMLQGTGQPAIEAEPTGPDRIEIAQVGAAVEFERDAQGHVVAAVLKQGGQVLRGPRK